MIQTVPCTTVLKDQVLAVEQWLVTDGETVVSGQPVCVIEMIQLFENDWMRGMCREIKNDSANDLSYPRSICSLQIPARAPGVVRHLKQAGERIDCGQPLFETVEFLKLEVKPAGV